MSIPPPIRVDMDEEEMRQVSRKHRILRKLREAFGMAEHLYLICSKSEHKQFLSREHWRNIFSLHAEFETMHLPFLRNFLSSQYAQVMQCSNLYWRIQTKLITIHSYLEIFRHRLKPQPIVAQAIASNQDDFGIDYRTPSYDSYGQI